MKHLKAFSLSLVLVSSLFAGEEILNETKRENLELLKKKTEVNAKILGDSWISPLSVSIGKTTTDYDATSSEEDTTTAGLYFSQDVFRSGGIWYAIEYAKAQKRLGLSNVGLNRNVEIVTAYNTLLQIKSLELSEKKQRLLIRNSEIDINRKRDQFVAGLIDISFLNNAIIGKTAQENALLDLLTNKEKLIVSFETISDKNYKEVTLPSLKMPSEEEFIEANLALKAKQGSIESTEYFAKMTKAKYLPKLTANASYVDLDSQNYDGRKTSYGLTLSMPLNINTFRDIEVTKVDALVAKNDLLLAEKEEKKAYERVVQDINRVEKKIALAKSDSELYSTLLKQTEELYSAGLKTKEDIETMENSKKIREIDQEIYSLDVIGNKLEIYTKLANGF